MPETPPVDVWDDDYQPCQTTRTSVFLPIQNKKSPPPPAALGLRINPCLARPQTKATDQPFEVQQFDGSVVRLSPEEPDVPKVERHITFHGRPRKVATNHLQRGEGKDWGNPHNHRFRWLLGASLGVSSLVILAMMVLPQINRSNASYSHSENQTLTIDPPDTMQDSAPIAHMLTLQNEAEQIFRAFATATTTDHILPLVRNSQNIASIIHTNHQPLVVSKSWNPAGNTTWNVSETEGFMTAILNGTLPDQSEFRAYFALTGDMLQLDWKATTAYGTATFAELVESCGNPAEIRGTILPSGLYTLTFPEAEFQSYQLLSPNKEQAIWCYTRRGELPDTKLNALFQGGEILAATPDPTRITLRLAPGADGSLPNQWLITEILHQEWITPPIIINP